jgi:hypothetical protein
MRATLIHVVEVNYNLAGLVVQLVSDLLVIVGDCRLIVVD